MASRWALRWLALVSVFVAVQLRMLLSQRAPGARAAPRVGAPARNGTARRCAVAAVARSRRPLERELHAAWVEAAARALEAFAFDEPPVPVVFHDAAFSADERRAVAAALGGETTFDDVGSWPLASAADAARFWALRAWPRLAELRGGRLRKGRRDRRPVRRLSRLPRRRAARAGEIDDRSDA